MIKSPTTNRKVLFRLTFILFFTFICSTSLHAESPTFKELQKQLDTLKTNNRAICHVDGYMIERDGLSISLDSGTVSFAEPINGRVYFAVFTGVGSITYTPTTKVEMSQLALFNGKLNVFRGIIQEMFIFFNDSTYEEITHQFPPDKKYFSNKLENFPWKWKDVYRYEDYDKTENIYFNNISSQGLLEKRRNNSMFCIVKNTNTNICRYDYDELEIEPISFYLYEGKSLTSDIIYVNSCPRSSSVGKDVKYIPEFSINKENLHVEIDDALRMKVKAILHYSINSENIRWVNYDLHSELKVESVVDASGKELDFIQPKDSYSFFVKLPNSRKQDSMTIKYSGKILKRIYNHTYLESSISWYPTSGYKTKSLFDITFVIPDNYKIVSIGNNVSSSESDGKIISRWKLDYPMRNASFNIGPFREKKLERNNVPPVTLHYITAENLENVINDVGQAYEFYTNYYGALPHKTINATEIPYSHGEAFPGMLHLSYGAFASGDNSGSWQSFVAHETGHQWWGIGVDFATYRDRWISEAFTEYSSLMYTQLVLSDNAKFFDLLKEKKKALLYLKKLRLKDGVDLFPVSLGHRVGSTRFTYEDYQPVVYDKGAWTLHMLRNMLINLKTMNEDVFKGVMKEFFTTYRGKETTTKDFQKIVEKHVGQDMSWFFEQWIDGMDIPEYHFAYKPEKQPDGKYKVHVRITQKNVPAEFKMSIPIKVVFKSGDIVRLRVFMTGEKAEFDLPLLPQEPKEIIFNDLESVLCTVENESWD